MARASDGRFPDDTTICRFRNPLVTAKLDQVLLRWVNVQLEDQGLEVAGSRSAMIDATIIESAAHPNRHVEVDDKGQADVVGSADEQARWVKKGEAAFFGYRAVDTEDRCVEHVEVHPANQAEVNKLPGIVDALIEQGIQPNGVLADKGFWKPMPSIRSTISHSSGPFRP